jgi:hypothetical protein
MDEAHNTQKTPALQRRATRGSWQPGQSGNPGGRPKAGATWAKTIIQLSEMTAEQIADEVGRGTTLGKQFLTMPKQVPLKRLVTARILAALMFEPTPGLWAGLMERAEGRVPLALDVATLTLSPEQVQERINTILNQAHDRLLTEAANEAIDGQVRDIPSLPDHNESS